MASFEYLTINYNEFCSVYVNYTKTACGEIFQTRIGKFNKGLVKYIGSEIMESYAGIICAKIPYGSIKKLHECSWPKNMNIICQE